MGALRAELAALEEKEREDVRARHGKSRIG